MKRAPRGVAVLGALGVLLAGTGCDRQTVTVAGADSAAAAPATPRAAPAAEGPRGMGEAELATLLCERALADSLRTRFAGQVATAPAVASTRTLRPGAVAVRGTFDVHAPGAPAAVRPRAEYVCSATFVADARWSGVGDAPGRAEVLFVREPAR